MFKQYRTIESNEFILVGGDCSQGGSDYNCAQFYSVTKNDVPLIYHTHGVASQMTTELYPVLNKIAETSNVKPVIGLERNMGGASEMERFKVMNRLCLYKLFTMPNIGNEIQDDRGNKLGFDTTALSRPIIVGGLKELIDINGITIYDQDTIDELSIFIENSNGKPEAAKGGHDDTVISLAIAIYMRLYEHPEPVHSFEYEAVSEYEPADSVIGV